MITVNSFILNNKPLGEYTLKEIQKFCKKAKTIDLYTTFNLAKFEPEELDKMYKQVCALFEKDFNYTGQVRIIQGA